MEKPGRNLRNLGEPWEPLRRGPTSEPLRPGLGEGGSRARSSSYRLRWASLYRPDRGRLRTAAAASLEGLRVPEKIIGDGGARTPRDLPRNTAEKWGRVCRHNGLFVAIPTAGENRDGIGQAVGRTRTRTRLIGWEGGVGHTRWRDRPTAWEAVRTVLAPVPAGLGRGCARASSLRRVPRCLPVSTAPGASLRPATRAPGRRVTQRCHAPALGALALEDGRPCQGKRMPPRSWRPALGGRREHGGHTPSWQGRAVRGGSPRGGVSLGLTASRTAPGSGCPLRPRGAG